MRILLTSAGGAAVPALAQFWSGKHVVFAADMDRNACPACIPVERCFELPSGDAPDYSAALSLLCTEQRIDLVIPGADEELRACANFLAPPALCPDSTYVSWALDKYGVALALRPLGLAPLTVLGGDRERLESTAPDLQLPVIVKPRWGRGSRGVVHCETRAEVKRYFLRTSLVSDRVIVQERIEGQEYTVTVVAEYETQRLRAIVPVRVERKRGVTIVGTTQREPRVIEACRLLHHKLPTRGVYNVQGILTSSGAFKIFEINPRVSSTLSLVIAADVDPLVLCFSDVLAPFSEGVTLRRRREWRDDFS